MTSVFSESNSRRICHSTGTSTILMLSASFSYDDYAASDVLLMTTLSLHSFMLSSQAESIIAAVSWLESRRSRPTSCNVSSTRQHESFRTRTCHVHFRRSQLHWLDVVDRVRFRVCVQVCRCLNTCRLTANTSPAFLVVAIGWPWYLDFPRVKLASYEGRSFAYAGPSNWNSLPAHLRDIVFLFHFLSATSNLSLLFLLEEPQTQRVRGSFTKTRYIN